MMILMMRKDKLISYHHQSPHAMASTWNHQGLVRDAWDEQLAQSLQTHGPHVSGAVEVEAEQLLVGGFSVVKIVPEQIPAHPLANLGPLGAAGNRRSEFTSSTACIHGIGDS